MSILPVIPLLLAGMCAWAADPVKPEDLPTTVKEAMDKAAHGASLSSIEKTTGANGKVVYTAKYVNKKGKDTSVSVSEDGKVVRNGSGGDRDKDKKK